MKRSELIQDALDDGHNEDKPSDSLVSYLLSVGEDAKPDNKQKSRE